MRPLPDRAILDGGGGNAAQIRAVAEVIARFHQRADHGPQIDPFGSPDAIERNWQENFRQTAAGGPSLDARTYEALQTYVAEFLAAACPAPAAAHRSGAHPRRPRRPQDQRRRLHHPHHPRRP